MWINRRTRSATLLCSIWLASLAPVGAQVPEAELEALYGPASAGTGIRTTAIVGAYVKSITPAGTTLTIVYQDDTLPIPQEAMFDFTAGGGGGSDGVLSGADFEPTTQILTLELTLGSDITVDLSNLTTLDEVNAAITAALASVVTQVGTNTSDINTNEIAIGNRLQVFGVPTANQIPIWHTGGGYHRAEWADRFSDGVLTGGSVLGGTATFTRSVGSNVSVPGLI